MLDGTDNFETRYLSQSSLRGAESGLLVSGALSQWEGQVSLFDPIAVQARVTNAYFRAAPAPEFAPSCAQVGVFAALPGVIGSLMAAEASQVCLGGWHSFTAGADGDAQCAGCPNSGDQNQTTGRLPDLPSLLD